MQTLILIVVLLTFLRGVFILKKFLLLGTVDKQIKKAEERLEFMKGITNDVHVTVFLIGVIWATTLISLSLYILFNIVKF